MRLACLKHARLITLLVAAACGDRLLDVQNPDIIAPGDLKGQAGAQALFEGARSEFITAHDGGAVSAYASIAGLVITSGLFSDEFLFPATPPDLVSVDRRDATPINGFIDGEFLALHRARTAADRAVAALTEIRDSSSRLAEASALAGYTYALFGETFCSGVPFSQTVNGAIEPGSPLSTQEMFEEALRRLDAAATRTAGDADVANLVRVGRGRVLLDLGRFADAGQAVTSVPDDFRFENPHSTASATTRNAVNGWMWDTFFLGMADREGTNGLDYVTAADPRTASEYAGISALDLQTPVYRFIPYNSASSPVVLASGVEARLIEAEAALRGNDPVRWLQHLNRARVQAGLGPLGDPGPSARVDLMFRERAFGLYGTAHRLGDLRRLIRQYGRNAEAVFPTGAYHKDNLQRGVQVALLVPQTEENNPNYSPADCDPTKP